ncbi:DNA replication complex GINS protein SLD5-like isoform X2 [Argentina anserina]|uniref:DNA replication complex GINS protein SLD5-like isoform X2 n=1 Tax=Argentina anserina TaxID=57926 RepID=UPI00217640F0|nr:DNA replication complex GINS protein SLD5-like isoform X2 [Potentilla anserina]
MGERDGEGSAEEYETLIQTTDVELLKKAWRQEKAAPEIMKFEADLIARLTGQIELVEENVEQDAQSGIDPLTVSLYQMDLDRTQFLLRSYLRIRLQKIEKYIFHILATAELYNRLSKQEKAFAKTCLVDLEKHLEESVLSKLPNNYQSIFKQSMISEENDMVAKPQLDTFVVCKTKYYLGHIQLEDNEDGPSDDRVNQRPLEEPFEMEPDVLYFVRYKAIKRFVEEGRIDLF